MSLLEGNKSILSFQVFLERPNPIDDAGRTPWQLLNTINTEDWMGKEAHSCKVIDIQQAKLVPMSKTALLDASGPLIDQAEYLVLVGYRPAGWISEVNNNGRDRLNGWQLEVRDQTSDGKFLNGYGQPLPLGGEPVFLKFEQNKYADFNEYEFGELLEERDSITGPKN